MESSFKDAKYIIDNAKYKLENLINSTSIKTLEDKKVYYALDRLIQELDLAEWTIKHYSKPVMEGYLVKNSRDRFELKGYEFTCGDAIEVFNMEEQEWCAGRVEHSINKGEYYFLCGDMGSPALEDGMLVRRRVSE